MGTPLNEEALVLKEKGNQCVKDGKFHEAVIHYTHAIKLDPTNPSLFSNRSLAFLKLQHFFQAHEDASTAISLKPGWAKGYYRKGEVLASTYQFADAHLSYRVALQLLPNDPVIKEAVTRTYLQSYQEERADRQIPWVGAGVGIILGVMIVISDQLLTTKPSISHPLLMALIAIVIALFGYGSAYGYRHYLRCSRKGMLDAPLDLLKEMNNSNGPVNKQEEKVTEKQRHTKAQSRLKLRKSKV